jgi:hypothetical protein
VLVRKWRKGNLGTLMGGAQIITAIMESYMEVPQKIKNRTTISRRNPASMYYPKE